MRRRRSSSVPLSRHLPSGLPELPSKYQAMWLFALFDLPVKTRSQRREATRFRLLLLRQGFSRLQYSVYGRYFTSEQASARQCERLKSHLPPEGQVRLLAVTERQFARQRIYWGQRRKPAEPPPDQLLMF